MYQSRGGCGFFGSFRPGVYQSLAQPVLDAQVWNVTEVSYISTIAYRPFTLALFRHSAPRRKASSNKSQSFIAPTASRQESRTLAEASLLAFRAAMRVANSTSFCSMASALTLATCLREASYASREISTKTDYQRGIKLRNNVNRFA
jgi:hypothetical protein